MLNRMPLVVVGPHFGEDPRSGVLFVFINKSHSMIRVLCYDVNGYWLATKRLSRGRYKGWPKSTHALCPLAASELNKIVKLLFVSSDKAL